MANVIHRTTLQYFPSVNEPDYPEPTYKWSPDMSQVQGVPVQYWKWDAGTERPVEMTAGEKADVDAAAATAAQNAIVARRAELGLGNAATMPVGNSTGTVCAGDDPRLNAVAGQAFPVGSVFISVVATNPAILLGYGVWLAIGAGRTLVGVDALDPDFDAAEKTGGAKTHTLTANEMPVHTHVQDAHSHGLQRYPTATGGSSGFTADTSMSGTPAAVTQVTANATAVNQNAGGGAAHNNLQPFLTVFVWKRTA